MRLAFWKHTERTQYDIAHTYAQDIIQFNKIRSSAFQRSIVQPTQANKDELDRLDRQIAIMERAMLKLTKPQD